MNNKLPNLVICTIGGKKLGFGHISRMIPIYDAFKAHSRTSKFLIHGDNEVFSILDQRNVELVNWMKLDTFNFNNNDIIIIDTLIPPIAIIEKLNNKGNRVYFVSDEITTKFWHYNVINWRVGAQDLKANNGLYGEKFVPLRKELFDAKRKKSPNSPAANTRLFISMGASDTLNLIAKTVEIIKNNFFSDYKLILVVRKFHKDFQNIVKMKDECVEILIDPSAKELFEALIKCDLAIASGGHSIFEFAYLGIPVIHVRLSDNQEPAKCWDETGFTFPIGLYQKRSYEKKIIQGLIYFTPKKLQEASKIGQKLIDGYGAERIFLNLSNLK
jgi:UDP-2,4-diacetamido-2,4,6-trideoxy-beta-L-altropyranose hydrolase